MTKTGRTTRSSRNNKNPVHTHSYSTRSSSKNKDKEEPRTSSPSPSRTRPGNRADRRSEREGKLEQHSNNSTTRSGNRFQDIPKDEKKDDTPRSAYRKRSLQHVPVDSKVDDHLQKKEVALSFSPIVQKLPKKEHDTITHPSPPTTPNKLEIKDDSGDPLVLKNEANETTKTDNAAQVGTNENVQTNSQVLESSVPVVPKDKAALALQSLYWSSRTRQNQQIIKKKCRVMVLPQVIEYYERLEAQNGKASEAFLRKLKERVYGIYE